MPIILIPILVVLTNDFLKALIASFKNKKFDIRYMFHSGGMPSGHSSFASSAITLTFLERGSASIEFMLATVFGILVMYDARGIRAKASHHAKILNKLQKEDFLDEVLGHTSSEVFVWALFWCIFSFILWQTWFFVVTTF